MEASKEGTFRNWMYRLALGVLSREDPNETFLKSIPSPPARRPVNPPVPSPRPPAPTPALAPHAAPLPLSPAAAKGRGLGLADVDPGMALGVSGAASALPEHPLGLAGAGGGPSAAGGVEACQQAALALEVIYPASLSEVLVRRRLRLLALRNNARHRRGLLGWALATAPQLPLALTPLPNVTIYYSVYRLVSHYRALQGANCLQAALSNPDSTQLQRLLHRLQQQQQQQQQQQAGGCGGGSEGAAGGRQGGGLLSKAAGSIRAVVRGRGQRGGQASQVDTASSWEPLGLGQQRHGDV
ncbi:mitochondrial K+-H+ exchange-related-domain-containing protein [Haematococcus lacustris]